MNSGMMYTFFTKSLASWLKIEEIERWPKGGAVFSWLHEDAESGQVILLMLTEV